MGPLLQFWGDIVKGLAGVLNALYPYTGHDYGLAIIALTLIVRVLMLPLTIKQTRSMQEMQRVQPMLKKLQEKYKDDKPKLQEEMMKFYQEHKVNPLGGCLPMLLQFPVMIALFQMLRLNPSIKGQPFLNLVPDLSATAGQYGLAHWQAGIPYFILVVLMVATTYIPQKMMTHDPQQEKMMIFMSIFMAWIAWGIPAGVILYWVTTNVWTMGQQYIMLRMAPAAPLVTSMEGAGQSSSQGSGVAVGPVAALTRRLMGHTPEGVSEEAAAAHGADGQAKKAKSRPENGDSASPSPKTAGKGKGKGGKARSGLGAPGASGQGRKRKPSSKGKSAR